MKATFHSTLHCGNVVKGVRKAMYFILFRFVGERIRLVLGFARTVMVGYDAK